MYQTLSRKGKKIIKIVLVAVSVGVILVLSVLVFHRGGRLFDEKEYYFVYTNSSAKPRELENYVERIKRLGGAGVIENFNQKSYLVVGVYDSREDANEVRENISSEFAEAGVLPVKAKKVKSKVIKQARQDELLYDCLTLLDGLADSVISVALENLSGSLSFDAALKWCIDLKIKLDEYAKKIDNSTTLSAKILEEINRERAYVDSFINTSFDEEKRSSVMLSLAVNLVKSLIDFSNNL